MKTRQFVLAALLAGMASSAAYADLHEVKENIKQDSKEAAVKTGHAARDFGHATADAAKTVGHGIAHVSREGWEGTKHATREGWEGTKRATKRVFHTDSSSSRETQKTAA
ncbi:conserved exported hypothetical protein [Paraburkholderia sacchari]|uniref:hypothetical protein n=1 Tax=Paraburkholderia sacchari TaxID=159450 RepID=UPI0039A56777